MLFLVERNIVNQQPVQNFNKQRHLATRIQFIRRDKVKTLETPLNYNHARSTTEDEAPPSARRLGDFLHWVIQLIKQRSLHGTNPLELFEQAERELSTFAQENKSASDKRRKATYLLPQTSHMMTFCFRCAAAT